MYQVSRARGTVGRERRANRSKSIRHALAGFLLQRITDEYRMTCKFEKDALLAMQLRCHY